LLKKQTDRIESGEHVKVVNKSDVKHTRKRLKPLVEMQAIQMVDREIHQDLDEVI
jgi:hypothetical protein